MRELAQTDVPVLIVGERGVGKCEVAQEIHRMSGRRDTLFGRVEPASLKTESLEQFGLTNNVSGNGNAGCGTLFLAEIGDSSPECQRRLLEAVTAPKAGGGCFSGTRVICGTSGNLEEDLRFGRFREDFYYWISGVCLRIPPLRRRKEDIPLLLDFFLAKHARELCRPKPVLSLGVQQLFLAYSWPGNVRELEAASMAIVEFSDKAAADRWLEHFWLPNSSCLGNGERVSLKQAARNASRQAERKLILEVLSRTRWNRKRAAQELQVSYKALLYKLKQIRSEE